MAPTVTTKTKSKIAPIPQLKKKKSVDNKKALAPKPTSQTKTIHPSTKKSADDKKVSASKPTPQAKPSRSSTKKSEPKKAKSPSPAPSESAHQSDGGEDVEEDEGAASENDHLHGFSTDDDDDSSDEGEGEDKEGEEKPGLSAFEISKLPTIAKDDETVKRKLEKAKRQPTEDRGVVYIGRLPHGFYEDQLRSYFSQFGDITRLRVSRNKKTGKCKHYGFIEFSSSSVAQIVAETMDNYLLTGHILKCKVIPKGEVHPELWIGANRKWRNVPRDRIVRIQHNKPRTGEERVKVNRRLLKRQNERKRKLEAMGIEYDFEAVGYKKIKTDAKA